MSEEYKTNASTEETKSAIEKQIEKLEQQSKLSERLRLVEIQLKISNKPPGANNQRIAANIAVILLFALGVFALLVPFCGSSEQLEKAFPQTKTTRTFTAAADPSDGGSDKALATGIITAPVPKEETITSCAPRVFAFWGYGLFVLAIFGGGLRAIVSLNKQE